MLLIIIFENNIVYFFEVLLDCFNKVLKEVLNETDKFVEFRNTTCSFIVKSETLYYPHR